MIGTIELHTNFSFVDVPESHADEVISSMRDYQLKGRGISFERASKSAEEVLPKEEGRPQNG